MAVIGRGGMGVVYRDRQRSLDRLVALKMIRAGEFASDAERQRFRGEAEAAAHLDRPNIVPIHEIGGHDEQDYFAMKLLEGGNLAERMAKGGEPRTLAADIGLLVKIARAVHHAHQRGVLHRDLKPANILLDAHGEPFVSDFGLAKRMDSGADLTLTGTVIGSPNYMSPEQAAGRSREVTTATDIYGLGAILYALLAGRPPFEAGTPMATMRKVIEEEPPPLRLASGPRPESSFPSATEDPEARPPHGTGVDRDLETICLKCLRKEPARRYPNAEALAEDLGRWLRHEPIQARPSTRSERATKWIRRHPARAGLLALSAAALAGFAALIWVHGERLQHERDHALRQEQRANAAAIRAEAGELAARERAYATDVYAASQAWAAGDLAQTRRLLDEQRPAPMPAGTALGSGPRTDLRGFEWRAVWERTRGQEAFAFTDLARPAQCLVFAPDGRTLVSGDDEGIQLWDLAARRPLGLFPGPDPGRPSGDRAPTAAELRPLLDASPGLVDFLKRQPALFDYLDAFGHTGRTRGVTSLALTPDGGHLLVGSMDLVRSWTLGTRAFDFAVPEKEATVATPAVGDLFVVANDQQMGAVDERRTAHVQSAIVYSFTRRRLVAELPGYGHRAVLSPDGRYVAAANRTHGGVLWRPDTGKILPVSQGPMSDYRLAFAPDGRTLFVGSEVRRLLWDVPSGRLRAELTGEHHLVGAAAWSPDGRTLATSGKDQAIALWRVPTTGAADPPPEAPVFLLPQSLLHGHDANVTALAFSPDGRWLASAADDRSIRLWSTAAPATPHLARGTPVELRPETASAMDPETGCVVGRVLGTG